MNAIFENIPLVDLNPQFITCFDVSAYLFIEHHFYDKLIRNYDPPFVDSCGFSPQRHPKTCSFLYSLFSAIQLKVSPLPQ